MCDFVSSNCCNLSSCRYPHENTYSRCRRCRLTATPLYRRSHVHRLTKPRCHRRAAHVRPAVCGTPNSLSNRPYAFPPPIPSWGADRCSDPSLTPTETDTTLICALGVCDASEAWAFDAVLLNSSKVTLSGAVKPLMIDWDAAYPYGKYENGNIVYVMAAAAVDLASSKKYYDWHHCNQYPEPFPKDCCCDPTDPMYNVPTVEPDMLVSPWVWHHLMMNTEQGHAVPTYCAITVKVNIVTAVPHVNFGRPPKNLKASQYDVYPTCMCPSLIDKYCSATHVPCTHTKDPQTDYCEKEVEGVEYCTDNTCVQCPGFFDGNADSSIQTETVTLTIRPGICSPAVCSEYPDQPGFVGDLILTNSSQRNLHFGQVNQCLMVTNASSPSVFAFINAVARVEIDDSKGAQALASAWLWDKLTDGESATATLTVDVKVVAIGIAKDRDRMKIYDAHIISTVNLSFADYWGADQKMACIGLCEFCSFEKSTDCVGSQRDYYSNCCVPCTEIFKEYIKAGCGGPGEENCNKYRCMDGWDAPCCHTKPCAPCVNPT